MQLYKPVLQPGTGLPYAKFASASMLGNGSAASKAIENGGAQRVQLQSAVPSSSRFEAAIQNRPAEVGPVIYILAASLVGFAILSLAFALGKKYYDRFKDSFADKRGSAEKAKMVEEDRKNSQTGMPPPNWNQST